jgi:hypothetical protein
MIKPAPSRRCGVDAGLRSILTRNPSVGFQRSFITTAQVVLKSAAEILVISDRRNIIPPTAFHDGRAFS